MRQFTLTCCSTADMAKEFFDEREIPYVCFHFQIGEKEYYDDLGQTIPFGTFYQMIRDGAQPTTSQVNVGEFEAFWEPLLKEGKDILHISLSSGLSGTHNSACAARDELRKRYPGRRILVADSRGASSGYGLLVASVADLRDQGMDIETAYQWIMDNRLKIHHWFFSTDLTCYRRGGRISGTEATLGTMLGICPLLNMNAPGRLIPKKKIRTKRKVIEELVKMMEQHVQDGRNYSGRCFMCHSDCIDDANKVRDLVEEKWPQLKGKIVINSIGTVIGSHTGPGTVALFFFGDERGER